MVLKTLAEWTRYIGSLHETPIDLGLKRVEKVARRLKLLSSTCPVITIAGTNGKGSCVAGLEAVYRAEGYKVGAFTSPYLIRLNEEVRINGKEASDRDFCKAFEKINEARKDISLTIFEFNTLAALEIFRRAKLDVILLEVGLGGRLDAVNIIDANLAIISSIELDHIDHLGATRELIAREKAGIFRSCVPAVCGDISPPNSLVEYATEIKTPLSCQNKDFRFRQTGKYWRWQSQQTTYEKLPLPALALQNMSTVLMAVELMQATLPVSYLAIDKALRTVTLPGRIEIFPGAITRVFDVAHNPAAAKFLAKKIKKMPCKGKTYAVFSMLADKDIVGTIKIIKKYVDHWYIAALPVTRGTPVNILEETFHKAKVEDVKSFSDISTAYQAAIDDTQTGDRVIVFGSFYTVAEVITHLLQ